LRFLGLRRAVQANTKSCAVSVPVKPKSDWGEIVRVAEALCERGELTSDEVDALLARPSRPPRRR
jgi:hypothetical protein